MHHTVQFMILEAGMILEADMILEVDVGHSVSVPRQGSPCSQPGEHVGRRQREPDRFC